MKQAAKTIPLYWICLAWISLALTAWAAAAEPSEHWAYVRPERPAPPAVERRDWVRNPVDNFVLARLEQEGMQPSPRASREQLARRLYLDLIGLPPTVAQLDTFLSDTSDDAYERLVDNLLASPHYGERWARPWLDMARYADSNGYQADQYREVWPYRDWVIQAMNDDMPFDRFTIEQLAGDLLPGATLSQKIATGFHRLTTCNVEAGVDPEENRVEQIIDRVNTTGTVWLGSTIECAQCHDHKYDPFTQRDYYRLFAYFNNTPLEVEGNGVTYNFTGPKMPLPLESEEAKRKREFDERHQQLQTKLDERVEQLKAQQDDWEGRQRAAVANTPAWHVLEAAEFRSEGGASHAVQDDHSVLISGSKPDRDTYVFVAETQLSGITAIKLETLTDPSLPGQGPGRHDAERPNFVLNEFQLTAMPLDGEAEPLRIELHGAAADFSQKNFDVGGAIDGDPKTAWAINPQFRKPHEATFLTAEPLGDGKPLRMTFRLEQNHGGGRTIGRLRLSAMIGDPSGITVPQNILDILAVAADERSKEQAEQLQQYYLEQDERFRELKEQTAKAKKQSESIEPVTTLVMVEMDEPRTTNIFERGNFLQKGPAVTAGTPEVLHPTDEAAGDDRLAMARWLVDPANPLVARVTVNRWWAELFGQGLVPTLEDFGTRSDPPSHPQLLDWLAVEFVEAGWSMKHIHKLIVMSAVYQQSSRVAPELLRRDPYNQLYARAPRFRLSAEAVRDNALVISGLFERQMGGPPIYPPQPDGLWRHVGRNAPKYVVATDENRFRRGVYVVWRRSAPYASFVNFDAPDRSACVVGRPRTNTPLQALTLLNDPAYVEMAVALATRALTDDPELSVAQRVDYLFRRCTSRHPDANERQHLVQLFQRELERLRAAPQKVRELLAEYTVPADVEPVELAAWFYVANVLLNLDETITKG